jgi:hypothetical protein
MGIKGLDSLEAVLAIVKDPRGFQAKIDEIKEETAKYQTVIESVVKLSEVNDYTASINAREASSKKLLEDAQATATKIVTDAYSDASDTKQQAKKQKEKQDERERNLSIREEQVSKSEAEVQRLRGEVQGLILANEAKSIELAGLAKELDERKTKLLAAINA